ncbi:hypothetical protein J6590_090472 [Homalodisca vitripennis]|nr:hypothetical protein J6590_090472 [Homalodisca vitripennis]
MLILSRVNFKEFMLKETPPGTIGGANPSGWSSEELYLKLINHFIKHSKPSKDEPVILITDNHETPLIGSQCKGVRAIEVSSNQSAAPSEVTIQSVTTQSEDNVQLTATPSRHTITQNKLYTMVTPEEMAPFPKAPVRKKGNRGKKPRRIKIATDTPKKLAIKEEKEKRSNKIKNWQMTMLRAKIKTKLLQKSCLTAVLGIIMMILTLAVKMLAIHDY